KLVKGGFILGGSGGSGVLLAHDPQTGAWSDPAFCRLTSVTMGLQIGAQVSELALMVMTEDALQSLLVDSIQLGGELSIALGPFSTGATAARNDIIAFSRTKGVYGGLTLEGATFSIQDQLNQAYYGRAVEPADILLSHAVSNEQAEPLRMVLAEASERQ
ncbi:MAG: lipid-binding SYLF domain-containing protein, partial [Geminicoccales bacterium]